MIIKVFRKELNEIEDYTISIEENENKEVVSPYDNVIIELLYEILNDRD